MSCGCVIFETPVTVNYLCSAVLFIHRNSRLARIPFDREIVQLVCIISEIARVRFSDLVRAKRFASTVKRDIFTFINFQVSLLVAFFDSSCRLCSIYPLNVLTAFAFVGVARIGSEVRKNNLASEGPRHPRTEIGKRSLTAFFCTYKDHVRVLFRSRDFHVRNTILFPRAFPCTSSLNESAVDQRWISKDLILIRQKKFARFFDFRGSHDDIRYNFN